MAKLGFVIGAIATVQYAIETSRSGGRPAFVDGNALTHRELATAAGQGPVTVGAIGGYRATTYRPDNGEWSVTAIEAP